MTQDVRCPYCGSEIVVMSNALIYGREYGNGKVWACSRWPECDAYVGYHGDGTPPGRLANSELRRWRKKAHAAFDPLWKGKRRDERAKAYAWLAKQLDIPAVECHIGMFDVERCKRVVQICLELGAGYG